LEIKAGQYESAEAHLRRAPLDLGGLQEHRELLAQCLIPQRKFKEAETELDQVLKRDPDRASALFLLGLTHASLGELDKAIEELQRGLSIDPTSAMAEHQLALIHMYREQWGLAEQHYRRCIELLPDSVPAWGELGLTFIRQERWLDAIEILGRATDRFPTNANLHRDLAFALHQNGNTVAADEHYRKADELAPTWKAKAIEDSLRMSTSPNASQRDGRTALELALQLAQATHFQDPSALEALATAYAEVGKFEPAAKAIDQALELAGSSRDSQSRLEETKSKIAKRETVRRPPSGKPN
jgi:tetratricopeptide (TPR) repeat protein